MLNAISKLHPYENDEHRRIVQELIALGLTPSGNLYIDKYKLNKAKEAEVTEFSLANPNTTIAEDYAATAQLEESRIGATQLAKINRLLLGL
ncbi:hypothetical protein IJD34_04790 [bacterium]|nr:hypothetical protein [bacterium]